MSRASLARSAGTRSAVRSRAAACRDRCGISSRLDQARQPSQPIQKESRSGLRAVRTDAPSRPESRVQRAAGGQVCGTAFAEDAPWWHGTPRDDLRKPLRKATGSRWWKSSKTGNCSDRVAPADLQSHGPGTAGLHPAPAWPTPARPTAQTFTVTSSNPDIAASIAQGPFWSVGVSYTDPSNSSDDFTGTLTFQLFQNLTPNTVTKIERVHQRRLLRQHRQVFSSNRDRLRRDDQLRRSGWCDATQEGTGSSGQPGTPFANENVQQLAALGRQSARDGQLGRDRQQRHSVLHQHRLAQLAARLRLHGLRPDAHRHEHPGPDDAGAGHGQHGRPAKTRSR